jgi:predicted transcriptional regulator
MKQRQGPNLYLDSVKKCHRYIYRRLGNRAAMKYRSRSEIIAMILQSANNGATKTRIMYGAYLSYAQVKEYLEFLMAKELLRYEQGTQLYRLTEKGMHFLRAFDQISDMMSVIRPNQAASSVPVPTRSSDISV